MVWGSHLETKQQPIVQIGPTSRFTNEVLLKPSYVSFVDTYLWLLSPSTAWLDHVSRELKNLPSQIVHGHNVSTLA